MGFGFEVYLVKILWHSHDHSPEPKPFLITWILRDMLFFAFLSAPKGGEVNLLR
jgi:hypothetical protein